MQRSLPPILLMTAILSCSAAQAQTADNAPQALVLAGDAPPACVIDQPTASNPVNASYRSTGGSSGQIDIAQFVDPQTALSQASSIELNLPVICNTSHRLVVRSLNGGLLRDGAVASTGGGGFSEFLSYQVSVAWNGQSIEKSSDGGATSIDAAQPGSGDMVIRVATLAGGGPMVAGQYNDAIVVAFEPAN